MTTSDCRIGGRDRSGVHILMLAVLLLLGSSVTGGAQQHEKHVPIVPDGGAEKEASAMPEHCKTMMATHSELQERQQALDAQLDELVAKMKAASGPGKVDAVAAVLETLVEQRREMWQAAASHQTEMMGHMMEHMAMKGAGGGPGMQCPMMTGKPTDQGAAPPEGSHSEHHR